MLSPVATGRKVEEKSKTFPIKRLEVIYELSSEAHGSDIQPFLSIQNVLHFKKSRVAVEKRHPPPHGSWTPYGNVSSFPSLPDFHSDFWLKLYGLSLHRSMDYLSKSIMASREMKIQATQVRTQWCIYKVGLRCHWSEETLPQLVQNFGNLWKPKYLKSMN